jgi:hypothetical protein
MIGTRTGLETYLENPGIVHFEHIYHCAHELISTLAPTAGAADEFRPSRRIAENLRA